MRVRARVRTGRAPAHEPHRDRNRRRRERHWLAGSSSRPGATGCSRARSSTPPRPATPATSPWCWPECSASRITLVLPGPRRRRPRPTDLRRPRRPRNGRQPGARPDHRPRRRPNRPAGDQPQGAAADGQRGQRDDGPHRRQGGVRLGGRRHRGGQDLAQHDPAVLRHPGLRAHPDRREAEAGLRSGSRRSPRSTRCPPGRTRPRYHDRRTGGRNASSWRRLAEGRRAHLNEPVASWPEGVFWLLALPAAAAGLGTGAVWLVAMVMGAGWPCSRSSSAWPSRSVPRDVLRGSGPGQRVRRPRAAGIHGERPGRHSAASGRHHRPRVRTPAPDNGVLHTKMVIADGQRATVLGSPYSQRYFDDPRHQIDNPERGDTTSDIVHDVSVGLVGPVVGDLHETFRVYWNEDQPSGSQIPSLPDQVATAQTSGPDGVVKVQVVRTQRGPVRLPRRQERRGSSRATCARSGETVHLPGEPVLHRRDHRRRPGQGSEGQAGP